MILILLLNDMPQEYDIMNNEEKQIYNSNDGKNKYIIYAILFAILSLFTLWKSLYYSILGCFNPGGCEMAGFYFYGYFPAFIISLLITIALFRKYNKRNTESDINYETQKINRKLKIKIVIRIIYVSIIAFLTYLVIRLFSF